MVNGATLATNGTNIPSTTKYNTTPVLPLPGSTSPVLMEAINAIIDDASKEKLTIDDLLKIVKIDPVSSIAIALKAMRAVTSLGNYTHPDKNLRTMPSGRMTIEAWMRGNYESMRGSLVETVRRKTSQTVALGFSISQIVWTNSEKGFGKEWRLKQLITLDPRRVEEFVIKEGVIAGIKYLDAKNKRQFIPYQNLLHICTDALEGYKPRGDAATRRAHPFIKARQLLFQAWAIASQKQATGTTVIQAPSHETVVDVDADGNPKLNSDGSPKTIAATEAAKRQAQGLENNGLLVTDLANRVSQLSPGAGESFFNIATIAFKKEIFLCYGVPSTIFDDTASGIGNSGINAGHRLILDVQNDAIVLQIKEQILEKICRPLLLWNFGVFNNFGDFESERFLDPSLAATRVSNLITALSTGVFDVNDLAVINRLRQDLGISTISPEEFEKLLLDRLLQQQQSYATVADNTDNTSGAATTGQEVASRSVGGSETQNTDSEVQKT